MTPHRFDARDHSRLSNEHRRSVQPSEGIIDRMSPSEGDICADLGCGIGYVTIPLSMRVRTMIALDVQREMLNVLQGRLEELSSSNVHVVQGDMSSIPLKDKCLDRVILVNVVHEVEDKVEFSREMSRILRRKGVASVVDFHKKETSFGPPLEERLDEKEMISLFSSFQVLKKWSFDEFYQIELQKP